jgi:hypothetical protein
MIEAGTSCVRTFLNGGNAPSNGTSSFDNWNDNDAVGHIIGWMNYSIDKLTCLKLGTKQSEEYAQVTSLTKINTILFNKMKDKGTEAIESEYINSLGSYIKVVALYTNSDINLDTFDTGFKMDLWRYMLMDTVIHPVQHVLYQYLKNDQREKLVDTLLNTKEIFARYAPGMDGYQLSEFELDREEYRNKLNELSRKFSDNKDVQEFVRVNTKDN